MLFHTGKFAAAALLSVPAMPASAQADQAVAKVLQTDNMGNILQTLAIPDGLPERNVANLLDDSLCLDDGITCLAVDMKSGDNTELVVQNRKWPKNDPHSSKRINLKSDIHENANVQLWNLSVKHAGAGKDAAPHYIIGVVATLKETYSEAYSGGSSSTSWLYLYDLSRMDTPYASAREIFSGPLVAEKSVQACFSQPEEKLRLGVCDDEYKFNATVKMMTAAKDQWPVMVYSAESTAYPRTSKLGEDNASRQLTKADLVKHVDEQCSFLRQMHYNPLVRRYELDSPAPSCSDYFIGSE